MSTQPPPFPPQEGGLGGASGPQYGPSQQGWVAGDQLQQQQQTAAGPSGPRAGFWQRFGAALIDGIIIGVVAGILFAVLKTAGYALGILLGVAYFTYFEGGLTGQTLGKRMLGIRVIDFATGGPIGYGRAFIRYIGRIVSSVVIYIGYLWMLWDKEKQTWHDKFATSVVVPAASYPVPTTTP